MGKMKPWVKDQLDPTLVKLYKMQDWQFLRLEAIRLERALANLKEGAEVIDKRIYHDFMLPAEKELRKRRDKLLVFFRAGGQEYPVATDSTICNGDVD